MNSKSVLRQLLRAIDRHITSVAGNQMWRDHVMSQFRATAHIEDHLRQQQLLLLAKEYAELVTNIAHHQELLQRYNIGIDPEDRNKDMVAKTAARVGFQLPTPGEQPPPPRRCKGQQQQQQQQPVGNVDLQQQQQEEQGQQNEQEDTAAQQQQKEGVVSVGFQQHQEQQQQQQQQHIQQGVAPSMAYAHRLQGVRKVSG